MGYVWMGDANFNKTYPMFSHVNIWKGLLYSIFKHVYILKRGK